MKTDQWGSQTEPEVPRAIHELSAFQQTRGCGSSRMGRGRREVDSKPEQRPKGKQRRRRYPAKTHPPGSRSQRGTRPISGKSRSGRSASSGTPAGREGDATVPRKPTSTTVEAERGVCPDEDARARAAAVQRAVVSPTAGSAAAVTAPPCRAGTSGDGRDWDVDAELHPAA